MVSVKSTATRATQLLLLFSLLAQLASITTGQILPRVTVMGRVVDESNGEALPNANVFLAETLLGAASDPDGAFIIRSVPLGVYDLVVSMVGYQRRVLPLRLLEPGETRVDVRLQPTAIQTGTVEVVAKVPREWRKNFERFEKEFFGETRNAAQCKIVNPEALDFRDEDDGFEVVLQVPIVIENRAFGYQIDFFIEEFRIQQYTIQYRAKPKFQELSPRDDEELNQWRENRRKAYYGSRRHFLAALARGTTAEEGFEVSLVPNIRPLSRNYREARLLVKPEQYVLNTKYDFQKRLRFPDYLQIVYTRERAEPNFQYVFDPPAPYAEIQVSWIKMNRLTVLFDLAGNTPESYALKVHGYWAFERVAELLPMDYEPPNN